MVTNTGDQLLHEVSVGAIASRRVGTHLHVPHPVRTFGALLRCLWPGLTRVISASHTYSKPPAYGRRDRGEGMRGEEFGSDEAVGVKITNARSPCPSA